MSEYTSLPVSKHLATAGFNETSDDRYNDAGTIPTDAYRADTLLAWLLKYGFGITLVQGGGDLMYVSVKNHTVSADTLSDALAETIIGELEVKA